MYISFLYRRDSECDRIGVIRFASKFGKTFRLHFNVVLCAYTAVRRLLPGTLTIKGIAPPTFVAQLPLQRALMMAGMLSKWKVSVLESVYQEIKANVSRKK